MRLLPLLLLLGCPIDDKGGETGDDTDDTGVACADPLSWFADADGDGFGDPAASVSACEAPAGHVADATDCDDASAAVFPGGVEVCDALDNDCDGAVDDDATDVGTFYADGDGDGYGDAALAVEGCAAPEGYVVDATDCDDAAAGTHPDAPETDCTDPTDYNCDGSVGYADADRDGVAACEDCDDADAGRSPLLVEVCDEADTDEDCDAVADDADDDVDSGTFGTFGRDADADGYGGDGGLAVSQCDAPAGYVVGFGDCDDLDSARNPDATEVCDAADVDEDCDGAADDADTSTDLATVTPFFRDADADGYGDAARAVGLCDAPAGYVASPTDCDDTDAAVSPGATEVCDAADLDEDCDRLADDDDTSTSVATMTTWTVDADADGWGALGGATLAACEQPAGYVLDASDCDDAAAAVRPDGTEVCDAAATDEDCDGLVEDDDASVTGTTTWHADADADGWGDPTVSSASCAAPAGWLADATDCDDTDGDVRPGGVEVCGGADEDCDGLVDDADAGVTGTSTWYADTDGDGYGAGGSMRAACVVPAGYVAVASDCDDGRAAVNPGAAEVCDASDLDEDCDGAADDADASVTGKTTWYLDADADGFGTAASTTSACSVPAGYASSSTDCDDGESVVHPGATEVCSDGVDDDCDGTADDRCGSGSFSGDHDADGAIGDADGLLYGETLTDWYGAMATGLDLDGDGVQNLVVAAYDAETTVGASTYIGGVYVYEGALPAVETEADDADVAFMYGSSTSSYASMGLAMAAIEDIDSDGRDELAATAVFSSSWTPYVYIVEGEDVASGKISDVDYALVNLEYAASGGDHDDPTGDNEWLGGNYTDNAGGFGPGAAYVYSGSTKLATLTGEASTDGAGYDVDGGEGMDVNGDGYDDVFVGTRAYHHAYVVLAPVSGTMSLADADIRITGNYDSLGRGVEAAGDMDGDGLADMLVGAPNSGSGGSNEGAVYLFTHLDPAGTSPDDSFGDATASFRGSGTRTFLGERDALAVGDVDGNGELDVVFGSYSYDSSKGAAWLVYGPFSGSFNLATDYHARFLGGGSDYCGAHVGLGDINSDGADDIFVHCQYGDATAASNRGTVSVFYGE